MVLWFVCGVMTPAADYLAKSRELLDAVARQTALIEQTAGLFAETILAGRMVHVFGSGHSRILVEEMWPRYGSFPGFNPIVELSLTFHNLVVGAGAIMNHTQSNSAMYRQEGSALRMSTNPCRSPGRWRRRETAMT